MLGCVCWTLLLVGLLGGPALSPPASTASAQTSGPPPATAEVLPDDVAAVARELNCPLCQGYNLQDCPLTVCVQMREQIARQLAAGQSAEEIKAAFVVDYGPQVLNAPPTRGFFLAAWVLPVVILGLGVLGLALFWWRAGTTGAAAQRGAPPATPSPDPRSGAALPDPPPAAYVERLERLAAEEER